jgi:hypothetical protein
VDPGLIAAAFGHGSDADILLEGSSVWEAFSPLAEGNEKTGRKSRTSARKGFEESEVGKLAGAVGYLSIEAFDSVDDGPQLSQKGLHCELIRVDDGAIGSQRALGVDRLETAFDGRGVADIVLAEEVGERFTRAR